MGSAFLKVNIVELECGGEKIELKALAFVLRSVIFHFAMGLL
jgi:hypothetical protein